MVMKPKETIDDYDPNDDTEAFEKLIAPPDWDGPIHNRNCTDVLCLLFLVISWIVMTIIGIYATANGDYRFVIYPLDYDGNICGTDFARDMTDYPYLYYINSYTGGVCVSECPHSLPTEDGLTDMRTLITYGGIWQTEDGLAELNSTFVQVADYSTSEDAIFCTTENCFPTNDTIDSWTSEGIYKGYSYAYYVAETYPLFQRCYITTDAENRIAELVDNDEPLRPLDFNRANEFFVNLFSDLWIARYWIVGFGFGCSLVVSLIYTVVLRIPCLLTGLVWFSIIAIISLFAICGYYAQTTAEAWAEEDPPTVRPQQIDYTRYASYALYAIAALLAMIGCCLRNQIQLAISCVKEAGKAINSMIVLLLIPFLQGVGLLCFWIVWGYYSASLASLGNIATRELPIGFQNQTITIRTYEYDDFVTQCGWYMLFCFYWTASFIVAIGHMVVAMAFSKWYFAANKKQISSCTVFNSLFATMIYHLGTCAYGSLIIAIIKTIRAILTKIQKSISKVAGESVASCLLCCCQCCMCCIENCMKFINKNAYIQCAIFGTPFCTSARKAFFLILRNAARIGAVSYVSAMVLTVGKLFISTVTTAFAYYTILEYAEVELYSYAGPVILIFIITYFVASMFMGIFEVGILTILHCFVADEEMFGGQTKYAEGGLKSWIDDKGAFPRE